MTSAEATAVPSGYDDAAPLRASKPNVRKAKRAVDGAVVILKTDGAPHEQDLLMQLRHPAIAQCLDPAAAVLVREFVDGMPLSHRVVRKPLDVDTVLPLAADIAQALQQAHRQGILHGRLEPGHVLVTRSEPTAPKLIGFGFAPQLNGAGQLTDTAVPIHPSVAPEQLRKAEWGATADIFAFGTLLFLALTGKYPQSMARALGDSTKVPRLDSLELEQTVPTGLADLVAECLKYEPADRPQDARTLIRRLASMTPDDEAAAPTPQEEQTETAVHNEQSSEASATTIEPPPQQEQSPVAVETPPQQEQSPVAIETPPQQEQSPLVVDTQQEQAPVVVETPEPVLEANDTPVERAPYIMSGEPTLAPLDDDPDEAEPTISEDDVDEPSVLHATPSFVKPQPAPLAPTNDWEEDYDESPTLCPAVSLDTLWDDELSLSQPMPALKPPAAPAEPASVSIPERTEPPSAPAKMSREVLVEPEEDIDESPTLCPAVSLDKLWEDTMDDDDDPELPDPDSFTRDAIEDEPTIQDDEPESKSWTVEPKGYNSSSYSRKEMSALARESDEPFVGSDEPFVGSDDTFFQPPEGTRPHEAYGSPVAATSEPTVRIEQDRSSGLDSGMPEMFSDAGDGWQLIDESVLADLGGDSDFLAHIAASLPDEEPDYARSPALAQAYAIVDNERVEAQTAIAHQQAEEQVLNAEVTDQADRLALEELERAEQAAAQDIEPESQRAESTHDPLAFDDVTVRAIPATLVPDTGDVTQSSFPANGSNSFTGPAEPTAEVPADSPFHLDSTEEWTGPTAAPTTEAIETTESQEGGGENTDMMARVQRSDIPTENTDAMESVQRSEVPDAADNRPVPMKRSAEPSGAYRSSVTLSPLDDDRQDTGEEALRPYDMSSDDETEVADAVIPRQTTQELIDNSGFHPLERSLDSAVFQAANNPRQADTPEDSSGGWPAYWAHSDTTEEAPPAPPKATEAEPSLRAMAPIIAGVLLLFGTGSMILFASVQSLMNPEPPPVEDTSDTTAHGLLRQGPGGEGAAAFAEAMNAFHTGRHEVALAAFTNSYDLEAHGPTAFNIAKTYAALGQTELAAQWFQQVTASSPEHARLAAEQLSALSSH